MKDNSHILCVLYIHTETPQYNLSSTHLAYLKLTGQCALNYTLPQTQEILNSDTLILSNFIPTQDNNGNLRITG